MRKERETAAVKWYAVGFALGANGARPTQRKGKPRLSAMVPHWRAGIAAGSFARTCFVGAYAAREIDFTVNHD
jgi:hypothetical protein